MKAQAEQPKPECYPRQVATPQRQTLAYQIRNRLYLNITDRCTLSCRFCPKFNGSYRLHEYDLKLHQRPTAAQVINRIGDPGQFGEVVFCGFGEPTLRLKLLLEVADYIKAGKGRVRINTDGLANRVHKKNILPEMAGRVDAISVSMNAQNETVYNYHCRPAMPGSYASMLDFLAQASRYIPSVTATAIDGLEGVDIDACKRLARELGVGFRRRVLDEVG